MKVAAALAFVCFMGVSVYVLLNEKNLRNPHPVVHMEKNPGRKKIGELRRGDLPPFELQRKRIDGTTIYKFESKNKEDNYALDEDQLDDFARSMNSKNSNGQKEYYQFDHE
ncbi:MAG: hypothetical protein H7336_01120 [Bacteriovorax sp.]|nr:hypothetical protein [Bacteriovorax sp.]